MNPIILGILITAYVCGIIFTMAVLHVFGDLSKTKELFKAIISSILWPFVLFILMFTDWK